MADPSSASQVGKAHFLQLFSERNEVLKNKLASIHISTAKGTLISEPFHYPEKISGQVAEGIVNYGDKLMSNALAESDDEGEIDELNQIGEDFQAMVSGTLLELVVDENASDGKLQVVEALYPMPNKEFHITKSSATQFMKALEEIRNYMKMRAFQGFSATIALVGEHTEDGVVFGGQQTVPDQVIEEQIKNMLEGRGKQLAPMAVDLITVEGHELKVATIKANEDTIERFIIKSD